VRPATPAHGRRRNMIVKDVAEVMPMVAGDETELRELLHPDRDDVELRYSLACAVVKPGKRSLRHRLEFAEVYYIIFGSAAMHVADEVEHIHAGHCVYIPPGSEQWIENIGRIDLAFLCVVDPPWKAEHETVLE
jgi:mannose-6-phosphate isomerase-like protein (cupin superfamily)